MSEELNGLNPQVQVAPFSLEMVSTLLVDALPVDLPEPLVLDPEPAVQPAASRPAPMMTPNLERRLMPLFLTVRIVANTGVDPSAKIVRTVS